MSVGCKELKRKEGKIKSDIAKNLNHKPVNMALKYVKIKVNISLEYLGFKYELWPRDNGNNKSSKNKHTGRAVYILEPAMVSQFCYF